MPDRSLAPEVRSLSGLSLPPENTTVLPNGATLHTYAGGDQPTATLKVLFDGGSDECGNPALEAVYAQILPEGSQKRTPLEISRELDFNGARYSPTICEHHTGFRLGMLCRRVPRVMELMQEIYGEPRFGASELKSVSTEALARLNYLSVQPAYLADRRASAMVFGPDHPSAAINSPEHIRAITPDVLRSWHTKLCRAEGCHAYLSGTLDDATVEAVRGFLSIFPGATAPMSTDPVHFRPQDPGVERISCPRSRQSAVVAGMPQINRSHPDYHRLRLAVMALGGYFGSRLMKTIREEQGLTYGITASLCANADGAYVNINAQCSHSNVEAVIGGIKTQMELLRTRPPEGAELERLRMHALTEALQTLDNPASILAQYAMRRTIGLPDDYFSLQQQAIATLTPDVIAATSARYLRPENLRIAIAGSY